MHGIACMPGLQAPVPKIVPPLMLRQHKHLSAGLCMARPTAPSKRRERAAGGRGQASAGMFPSTARLGLLLIPSLPPCDAGSSTVGREARGSAPRYALAALPAPAANPRSRSRPVPVPVPAAGPRVPAQQRPLQHGPAPPHGSPGARLPALLGDIPCLRTCGSGRGCRCAGCAFAAGPPTRACGAPRCKNAMCLEMLSRGRAKDLCAL